MIAWLAAALMPAAAPDPSANFSKAIGAALQADEVRALALLDGVDLSRLPARDRAVATCMRERFGPDSRPAAAATDSLADRALAIYRRYWHAAMTRPQRRAIEEQRLETELRQLLGASTDDAIDGALSDALKKEGVYSLQGRTGLLRELMMWSKQDEKLMRVALPEGEHAVKVILLDGFKSLGWSFYATCGRRGTGGWATDQALYAPVPRYESLDSEEFKVSFLGHEAQHFADKARFKKRKPWEAEYRAKLTELALASHTRAKVLGKFIEDQGDDPASPHSYANRRLLGDMARKLGVSSPAELFTADAGRVRSAAVELLLEDTQRRTATGERG